MVMKASLPVPSWSSRYRGSVDMVVAGDTDLTSILDSRYTCRLTRFALTLLLFIFPFLSLAPFVRRANHHPTCILRRPFPSFITYDMQMQAVGRYCVHGMRLLFHKQDQFLFNDLRHCQDRKKRDEGISGGAENDTHNKNNAYSSRT